MTKFGVITSTVTLLCVVLFCNTCLAGGSDGYVTIPRAYGPFKLGMSATEFTKLTGIIPVPCVMCIDDETYSALSASHIRKFIPDHKNREGVDFFFLNRKLYLISRTPDINALNVVADDMTQALGAQGSRKTQSNGVSVMKWQNNSTIVSINYNDANNEVFSINLLDAELSSEKARREESLAIEQTANIAQ